MNQLLPVSEVRKLIEAGKVLFLAGDEALLETLPSGNWVGGTIPYFVAQNGGQLSEKEIFVTEAPKQATSTNIQAYSTKNVSNVAKDSFENGFSFIVIPAFSELHTHFAQNVYNFEKIFLHPLVGWVTGINLENLGKITPKVFDGRTGKKYSDCAVVMHIELPKGTFAKVDTINLFTQGSGDKIVFEKTGFSTKECLVNGKKQGLAQYMKDKKIDVKLPLVANYSGAMINVCFQGTDEATQEVKFYGPLFKGVEYRFANPIKDYVKAFHTELEKRRVVNPTFSCNCVLNYLFLELEGKKLGNMLGPVTFGEIAYGLLNQTMVYLTLEKLN